MTCTGKSHCFWNTIKNTKKTKKTKKNNKKNKNKQKKQNSMTERRRPHAGTEL
jgi:hypothetical protein